MVPSLQPTGQTICSNEKRIRERKSVYLVGIQAPETQLLFEQGPTHVRGVVQFPGPVVIQDLCKYPRVSVEEILALDCVEVDQIFGQFR